MRKFSVPILLFILCLGSCKRAQTSSSYTSQFIEQDSLLCAQANQFTANRQWQNGIDTYLTLLRRECDSEMDMLGARKYAVDAMVGLMVCYQYSGDKQEGVNKFQEIYSEPTPLISEYCWRDLNTVYALLMYKAGMVEQAEKTMDFALGIEPRYSSNVDMARDYAYAAVICSGIMHRQLDAIKYCEKSLEYFDGSRNVAQFRKVEVLLGDLYTKFGSTYEAISLYERGLERAEELGDVYSQSFYCNQLTRVNISLEIMDNAELYSGKALALVDLVRPRAPLQVANSYNNKGHLMLLKGQKDSAQVYWHKAMDIYEMLPYTLGNESLDLDFGRLLVSSKVPEEVRYGVRVLERCIQKAEDPLNITKACYYLAEHYLKEGDRRKGENYLESMYGTFASMHRGIGFDDLRILRNAIEVWLESGNLKNARRYFDVYAGFVDMAYRERMLLNEERYTLNASRETYEMNARVREVQKRDRVLERKYYVTLALLFVLSIILIGGCIYMSAVKVPSVRDKVNSLSKELEMSDANMNDVRQQIKNVLSDDQAMSNARKELISAYSEFGDVVFKDKFSVVYPDFSHNLREMIPGISPAEEIYCMFVVLGLSAEQIAEVTGVKSTSVNMTSYRLRKKMNLDRGDNLKVLLRQMAEKKSTEESS